MTETLSLEVSAQLGNLAVIRDFIAEAAGALGIKDDGTFDVVQAVDELATNVIVHGYRGQPGTIGLQVRRESNRLIVILSDHAPPFDPTLVPPPDLSLPLDQRPIGKLGLVLARRELDEMIYHAPPQGGNELTLIKKLTTSSLNPSGGLP